jgi:hypothetical protein
MTPEQIQQLIDTLLSTTQFVATKAFELAMRQILVYAILDLAVGIPMLILGAWGLIATAGNYWRSRTTAEWEDIRQIFFMLLVTVGFVISVSSVRLFVNPEWYAVKLLLETVGVK